MSAKTSVKEIQNEQLYRTTQVFAHFDLNKILGA